MTYLVIWNISYGQKKGQESNWWESNWQFDSRSLKVKNHPDFLACRWRATYHWKALDKGYNFALDFILIEGLHTKLWCPKVAGVLTLGISGLPLGSPGKNAIWMLVPWPAVEYTIRWKVVASFKFWPWWVLWVQICPWFVLTPKVLNVATLALDSRLRQGVARWRAKWETREHSTCSRECKKCEGMSLHTPKWTLMLGVGVPKGVPNLQSAIAGVKSPRLEEFFISLKRSWSVDVKNGLVWAIWTSATQVMGKRKAGSQTASWEKKSPDH
jgi:hypothetical protein